MSATQRRWEAEAAGEQLDALVALTALAGMGPRRLRAVLAEWDPVDAWRALARGRLLLRNDVSSVFGGRLDVWLRRWAEQAGRVSPATVVGACDRLGVEILIKGATGYPARLLEDPDPPLLLFARGDLHLLDIDAVAIVGTRTASAYGLEVAFGFGATLADAGVAVVSGLAAGIDGAAHQGALSVPQGCAPIGVVGSGLDVVYPRSNRSLWHEVGERGLLLSEAPPGVPPEPWRFPSRNRIIAALSRAVVVVESPATGGSMITADEAVTREIPVLAVPGSIHSPVSVGPNTLLFDGCSPARSAEDVLGSLGWFRPPSSPPAGSAKRAIGHRQRGDRQRDDRQRDHREHDVREHHDREQGDVAHDVGPVARLLASPPPLTPPQEAVLDAIGWEPAGFDDVVERTGMTVGAVALVVEDLVRQGVLRRERGFVLRLPPTDREGRS